MRLTLLFNVAIAFLLFASYAAATDVSIRISNGKTVTLVKTGDVFDRAENERAKVTTSGLFDDRERGRIFMRWVFSIQFKQSTMVRNVRVEDVTDTVGENIRFFAGAYRVSAGKIKDRTRKVLCDMDLERHECTNQKDPEACPAVTNSFLRSLAR